MQRDTETESIDVQTAPAARRGGSARGSAAAFRASVEERLRALEWETAEVKGRINGLIFLIAGTVAAQVILRLIE